MDPITAFLVDHKIPVGAWGRDVFAFLTDNFNAFFRGLSGGLNGVLGSVVDLLLFLPPSVVILLVAALAFWLQRSWALALGVVIGLAFIVNQGLWRQTVQTLVLVVAATIGSMAIGVPLGIWAAHRPKAYRVVRPFLDFLQTMPTFVYLIPVLALFGLGAAPGLIVTVLFVVPTAVRMTHLGVTGVPKAIIEAGEAFGATRRQLLWKVELPAALPTIMSGLTQCIMLSLSMVVVAALIGASGLGTDVVRALNAGPRGIPLGIEAGLAIVILAIVLDRMTRLGPRSRK
jgi:glycine betaine/proline transport system permease protein